MKKHRLIQWLALLLTGALLLCFAACREVDPPPTEPLDTEPEDIYSEPPTVPTVLGFWSIELRGVPNVANFTSEHAQYLPKVQFEMTTTNPQTGLADKYTYGGITLRSLLNYVGVQNVTSVTVASLMGTTVVYNEVMAMAEDTILAWEINGASIDSEPPLRMCPKSGPAEMHVWQVSSLDVVPAAAVPTDPYPNNPYPPPTYDPPPMGDDSLPTWSTSSVSGVDPPTTETTTTTTTTTTNTILPPWTTRTYPSYVGPGTTATTAMTKPDWWPDGVEWP